MPNNKVPIRSVVAIYRSYAEIDGCVICKTLSIGDHYIAQCGDVFCHECILEIKKNKFSCPIDNSTVDKMELLLYYPRTRLIHCKCPMIGIGCCWTGTIEEYDDHYKECFNNDDK